MESALLAVIGLVLVLLGQYVPFLGIAASLLWPLPSALVVLRHGMRWGVMASVLTVVCLSMFMNWITALSLWVLFALQDWFSATPCSRVFPAKIIVAQASLSSWGFSANS